MKIVSARDIFFVYTSPYVALIYHKIQFLTILTVALLNDEVGILDFYCAAEGSPTFPNFFFLQYYGYPCCFLIFSFH